MRYLVGISVVPNTGHLPQDFDQGSVGLDREAVVLNLSLHDRMSELSDHWYVVAFLDFRAQRIVDRNYFVT